MKVAKRLLITLLVALAIVAAAEIVASGSGNAPAAHAECDGPGC